MGYNLSLGQSQSELGQGFGKGTVLKISVTLKVNQSFLTILS